MNVPIYQVDAFSSKLFGGNPAAICPLDDWLPDALMQAIAAENNLAETAFYISKNGKYHLRWFTPGVEVDLCGHATLATRPETSRRMSIITWAVAIVACP